MAKLRCGLVFGLVLSFLALGSADEIESFLNDNQIALSTDGLNFNLNKFLDDNAGLIQDLLQRFDPTKLLDVPLLGKGRLTNGYLSALSKLKRTGDSTLKYDDKVLTVDLKFGWDILKYDFDYDYKLWAIPRHGKLHGSVEDISISFKLSVDFKRYRVVLEQFRFGNIGKLGLELEGTFGDKIRSLVGKLIINLGKNLVKRTIEKIASKTIEEKMNDFNAQIQNELHQFTYINLVELNRNMYGSEEDIEEIY